jgi:hypothetical protein
MNTLYEVDGFYARIAMAATVVSALDDGAVFFTFIKKTTGKTRNAKGTRNKALYTYSFRGGSAPKAPGLFRYWDFEKNAWRSFYIDRVQRWRIDYTYGDAEPVEIQPPVLKPVDIEALVPEDLVIPLPKGVLPANVITPTPPPAEVLPSGALLVKPAIRIIIQYK